MPPKSCTVIVADVEGTLHGVDVTAETLYEAACLGLSALKSSGWSLPIGPATRVQVEVRGPVTRHTLSVGQVEKWVAGGAKSPSEQVLKNRLKKLLAASA